MDERLFPEIPRSFRIEIRNYRSDEYLMHVIARVCMCVCVYGPRYCTLAHCSTKRLTTVDHNGPSLHYLSKL